MSTPNPPEFHVPYTPQAIDAMNGPLEIRGLTISQGVQLLAVLQLALRHPGISQFDCGKWALDFAHALEKSMGQSIPELKPILAKGWLKEFDTTGNRGN